jgi:hypothetical protein
MEGKSQEEVLPKKVYTALFEGEASIASSFNPIHSELLAASLNEQQINNTRLGVHIMFLTVESHPVWMLVFWLVTRCGLVGKYQHCREKSTFRRKG